jgi:4-diphosphocytidyl-2C-methyl-D-erythritol kinase
LACPQFDLIEKTRALYAALTPDDWSDGTATANRAFDADRASGWQFEGERFVNVFDRAAIAVYPNFGALRQSLERRADVPLSLTGAGPSLYALFDNMSAATAAARHMGEAGVPTYVARSVVTRPKIETMAAT